MRRSILDGSIRVVCTAVSAALLAVVLGGCPGGSTGSRAPVESCEEIGQRCELQSGKVGICTGKPDGELQCVPQH